MTVLLSKERRITEKGMMEFQPFGIEPDGTPIRDLSGVVTRAHVERLEELVGRRHGPEAGREAVEQFVRLLNERIPDQAYHVTAEFLRNPWNSYSNEFSAYVGEFCVDLSGDPLFAFGMARERAIANIIQVLGRPFSVQQIYRMSAYFSKLYAKDSFLVEAASVGNGAAVLRMTFGERTRRQFGRYRRRCAFLWCISVKGYFVGVPERFHNLEPAVVKDLQCMADGHDCCEWEVTWAVKSRRAWVVVDWLRGRRPAAVLAQPNGVFERAGNPPGLNARKGVSNEAAPIESAGSTRQGMSDLSEEGRVTTWLSNEHRITEKERMMQFQPFGIEPDGTPIRDLSGVVFRADVEYMEEYIGKRQGKEAAERAVEEVARRLNERIPDPAYYVTPGFLRNPWNSYSAEFSAFMAEFCIAISGAPDFLFNMARYKAISPIIQTLGKPFSVARVYKMSAYFAQRYAKDSFFTEAVEVSEGAALVQMRLSERTYRQFGPYRRACAEHWCNAHKGYFVGVPEMFHGLSPATVIDRRCIAKGDDYCEWEISWSEKPKSVRAVTGAPARRAESENSQQRDRIIEDQFTTDLPGVGAGPQPLQTSQPVSAFLSKDHPITENGRMMEFQPFGIGPDGTGIRDVRGMTIVACLEHLEGYIGRTQDAAHAKHAVEELARQLNARIPDRAYHVTSEFLRKPWNSYSFEFAAFLGQLCTEISGDPQFHFNMARERAISPFVQVLGRPFSVPRIYKMSPYFAQIYTGKNMYSIEVVSVSKRSAILRMRFGERALQHFGRYLKACALHWCNAHKGYCVAVPENFHQLPAARVTDRACIAEGDPYCEWEVSWSRRERTVRRPIAVAVARWILRKEIEERERLIDEQVRTLDARHVELQEAYVQQQQITAELQRRVDQLTTLHETGLLLTSILNRETLIEKVLEILTGNLRYDRGMISFFDRTRQVSYDARIAGVSNELAAFVRAQEVPVTDPSSMEGTVLLRGEPILVGDIREVWDRIHPLNQQFAVLADAKSFISVPLKVKNEILGCLTVDRAKAHALTKDDLNLMGTMASQVAIALDTTNAYSQIEALNIGLEAKVQARTQELQAANEKLRELDRLKSSFVSMVSHELRTPMTSIKGYVDNLLDGVAGPLNEKPAYYLKRVKHNVERLTRMINDLLDLSRIEAGAVQLQLGSISVPDLLNDVVEGFQTIATERSVNVKAHSMSGLPLIQGDRDKLYQVLNNLIQNAIKFTPKGGAIVAEARAGPPGYVQICVSDTGCGIAPEERGKVFERFYRGESVAIEDRGAGLGLAITKNLVELHHGRIWVESTPGEGSRFFFTLPVSQAS